VSFPVGRMFVKFIDGSKFLKSSPLMVLNFLGQWKNSLRCLITFVEDIGEENVFKLSQIMEAIMCWLVNYWKKNDIISIGLIVLPIE